MTATAETRPGISVGSLVRARGRDWVVLPSRDDDVLRLRPLTGTEEDAVGLFLPLEGQDVRPASFEPPDPRKAGDAAGALLLCDAARLSIRNGAAPFRSLGRIAVRPRPYQFVPLVMALRQDIVRLLIADDVGVGKTIEAGIVARELLDRGLARRLAVICPAHLCEQWQSELQEKFAIDAKIVQPATIGRLERELPRSDIGIYRYYRHLVVSIDFIKSDRNLPPFLQNAPDLIVVDEAHIASRPGGQSRNPQQQRYELIRKLAEEPARKLLLVTATPHSGVEESFRSLLGLLNPEFDTPEQGGPEKLDRRRLLPYVVQRRRADLRDWLGTDTPFPERRSEERSYSLSPAYHQLFEDILDYCRETVSIGADLRRQQQRVRHWAAIALLRCALSSPAMASAVLSNRADGKDAAAARVLVDEERLETDAEIDDIYRPQVLDPLEEGDSVDYAPTAPLEDAEPTLSASEKGRLTTFLKKAEELAGPKEDHKLADAARALADLLRERYHPIVFCRFIATAKYLEEWLPRLLSREHPNLVVKAVTGEIGDSERRERVDELARHDTRVLVATDCLSEGINLQEHFDAVLHYDLPWNPNRLEQREGRVDRFGQKRPEVKTVVLYGADSQVDLVVLDVLIRKARRIRQSLGIAVPVPAGSDQVIQAVIDSVLLRGRATASQLRLALDDPEASRLHREWDLAAEREGEQRAFFSQGGIQPDEVSREIDATDPVLGDPATVQRFMADATQRLGGSLRPAKRAGTFDLNPGEMKSLVANLADGRADRGLHVTFDALQENGAVYLNRTSPLVAAYCDTVLGKALGLDADERFARSGAIVTDAVNLRTAVLLLRMRYLLRDAVDEFAEEIALAAFRRHEGRLGWLQPPETAARELLQTARPVANLSQDERAEQVVWALAALANDESWFAPVLHNRVAQLAESNGRLRSLVHARPLEIVPHTPPDILGCYVLVPAAAG